MYQKINHHRTSIERLFYIALIIALCFESEEAVSKRNCVAKKLINGQSSHCLVMKTIMYEKKIRKHS